MLRQGACRRPQRKARASVQSIPRDSNLPTVSGSKSGTASSVNQRSMCTTPASWRYKTRVTRPSPLTQAAEDISKCVRKDGKHVRRGGWVQEEEHGIHVEYDESVLRIIKKKTRRDIHGGEYRYAQVLVPRSLPRSRCRCASASASPAQSEPSLDTRRRRRSAFHPSVRARSRISSSTPNSISVWASRTVATTHAPVAFLRRLRSRKQKKKGRKRED
ncbi:hypothetical protein B0H16DRAFT_1625225 [Mycena metata]|uniref:Uncharacterized protein n=1 Tax=Mycena metata TaxID=1033252 RepID=A0AAD7H4T8_9AGAR|nr:hypothetical protein B0H16DRAFT_1625225 [Mycena metata]